MLPGTPESPCGAMTGLLRFATGTSSSASGEMFARSLSSKRFSAHVARSIRTTGQLWRHAMQLCEYLIARKAGQTRVQNG